MNLRRLLVILMILVAPLSGLLAGAARAQGGDFITLASTTSTQNSGLLDFILPKFTAATGITVNVVAVGTGQALRIGRNGDADVLLVHHRASEDAFVADGNGSERRDVMFNDFIIVGPAADPAGIAGAASAPAAVAAIARSRQTFASRGDDSGTNKRELELWARAEIKPAGAWYLEVGTGMGATLNLAAALGAYTITDRGTWMNFHNRRDLVALFQGDKLLFNPYGILLVNPARHPYVKAKLARRFADWMTSPEGQRAIAAFRINGLQAFCPDAQGVSPEIADRAACPVKATHIRK